MVPTFSHVPRIVSGLSEIIGHAPSLQKAIARAQRFAPSRSAVLVMGESGTGKELFARLLHEQGPDPDGPLVPVNCGALSRELAESELFGHERGAFTGAAARRGGWFEEASGGTLVLDEIGELPLELQPKLLRVLETGRMRRVGGSGETAVRVRVVALTLRNLREEVDRGRFRADLYHRLSPYELVLPALRERPTDIPLLIDHFLDEAASEVGRRELTSEARSRLAKHPWPGNVRELRNVIRRAAVLCDSVIDVDDLELAPVDHAHIDRTPVPRPPAAERASESEPPGPDSPGSPRPFTCDGRCREEGATLSLPGRKFIELEKSDLRVFPAPQRGQPPQGRKGAGHLPLHLLRSGQTLRIVSNSTKYRGSTYLLSVGKQKPKASHSGRVDVKRAVPDAGGKRHGLRHLHARPAGPRPDLERGG